MSVDFKNRSASIYVNNTEIPDYRICQGQETRVWYYVFTVIGGIAIILNIFVIIAIIRKQCKLRWQHKPSLLILSLAFSDLLQGASSFVVHIFILLPLYSDDILQLMMINIHVLYYSIINGLLHVVCLTLERFCGN